MSYECELFFCAGMTIPVMDNLLERYNFLVRSIRSNPLYEHVIVAQNFIVQMRERNDL